jgi:hypothetical protein
MRGCWAILLAAAAASCAQKGVPHAGSSASAFAASPSGYFSEAYLPNAAGIFFDDPASADLSFAGGVSASRIGGATFFSDGVTATRIGDATYFSNGVTAFTSGDAVLFSDGRRCARFGADLSCF